MVHYHSSLAHMYHLMEANLHTIQSLRFIMQLSLLDIQHFVWAVDIELQLCLYEVYVLVDNAVCELLCRCPIHCHS